MFNIAENEKNILDFWNKEQIFKKSLEKEAPRGEFSFYDGPPFATGLPHYGHIVASAIKDMIPRYMTMRGYKVERRWGWDCHGLPVENLIEKELGFKTKKDIENFGVDKFNEACRASVFRYADEWKKFIPRVGRWVDMDNDYRTMNPEFMQSTWWVFKTLWDKGLIYEGHKAMHVCPRCETTLANFEVTQGYKDITDLSATVKFELVDEPNTFVLAWTTTPWTLPGNVALAVGKDIMYSKVSFEGANYIIASSRLESVFKDKEYQVISEFKGIDLIRKEYKPVFDYFVNDQTIKNIENGWKIYSGDFVTTEDGTGIVHIAPAFGEDDMKLGQENDLPFIQHVRINGTFVDAVAKDFGGGQVKPKEDSSLMDVEIVKNLISRNKLFAKEKFKHSYPHCWRCDTPLLNYATSSWFVNVKQIQDKLIKNNKEVHWVPEHIKEGRFGKWIENSIDWAISRSRFWGSPIPVWKCENEECKNVEVIGGVEELKEKLDKDGNNRISKVSEDGKRDIFIDNTTGKEFDLHKHIVDGITFTCPKCGKIMKRIPEVFDCWFESGSMPYSQLGYPFSNKEKFEGRFPADFIAEGQDQTRGWFYTLMVLATALFDKPAFKNVVVNGIVLAEDGQKMSKKLKNYPDPNIVVEKYGADALRYYLLSSPVVSCQDLSFFEKGVEDVVKKDILKIVNVLDFYKMTSISIEVYDENKLENNSDKWIIARLNELIKNTSLNWNQYYLAEGVREIEYFIDDLSNWYVRINRTRFKTGNDREIALSVLRYVLSTLSKVIAPVMPFIAEYLYKEIDGKLESVHLESFPEYNEILIDKTLLNNIAFVRDIVSLGLSIRKQKNIAVKQPLNNITVVANDTQKDVIIENKDVICSELNIKEINIASNVDEIAKMQLKPNARVLGPKFGKQVQFIINKVKSGEFVIDGEMVSVKLDSGEECKVELADCEVAYVGLEGIDVASDHGVVVALNTNISEELRLEGIAREIISSINDLRAENNLTLSDKVNIEYFTESESIEKAIENNKELILNSVAANTLNASSNFGKEFELSCGKVNIEIK